MTSPLNNLTDTWNNSGTVFTGLKYNITNTASAAGSKLFDFQIASSSIFNVDKTGLAITVGAIRATTPGTVSSNALGIQRVEIGVVAGDTSRIIFEDSASHVWNIDNSSNIFRWYQPGIVYLALSTAALDLNSAIGLSWNADTLLQRDAASIIAQRNSTTAQTLRVYNTFTDASNYERGVFDWTTTANTLTIGSQTLGTGTLRKIKVVGAGILTDATVLPTSNPSVTGQLWNNGGVVTVS